MEFSTLRSPDQRLRSPRARRILGVLATAALGISLLTSCSDDEKTRTGFIDCKKTPGKSISTTLNTLQKSTGYIGDAITDISGSPQWREEITVESLGKREFSASTEGLGPIVRYEEVVAIGSMQLFRNSSTGSKVTATAPPVKDPTTYPIINVEFHCGRPA
jgi:hypothetical protein